MSLHIHAPQASERRLVRMACPTCAKPRWMTAYFVEWYGWDHTCLKCGEHWSDGEMTERPFVRAWRKKAVEEARRRWRAYGQREAARAAMAAQAQQTQQIEANHD